MLTQSKVLPQTYWYIWRKIAIFGNYQHLDGNWSDGNGWNGPGNEKRLRGEEGLGRSSWGPISWWTWGRMQQKARKKWERKKPGVEMQSPENRTLGTEEWLSELSARRSALNRRQLGFAASVVVSPRRLRPCLNSFTFFTALSCALVIVGAK